MRMRVRMRLCRQAGMHACDGAFMRACTCACCSCVRVRVHACVRDCLLCQLVHDLGCRGSGVSLPLILCSDARVRACMNATRACAHAFNFSLCVCDVVAEAAPFPFFCAHANASARAHVRAAGALLVRACVLLV